MIRLLASLALAGATVYTGEGPPLEGATVLIEGNRVAAVGRDLAVPEGADVIDLTGSVITPGLIDAASRLGVTDVILEGSAVEGTAGAGYDPVRAALRVADGFNPYSFAIPVARQGGLTAAVIVPVGGLISGRSIWINLDEREAVREAELALHVSLSPSGRKRGSRARALLRLREVLEDARLFRANRGPYISHKLRDLSVSAADLEVVGRALDRELPVVFEVDRAAEIHTVLELIREHRLNGVLLGAAEGWMLADEIATAGVPVLVNPLQNLPVSFDTLQSRADNAVRLRAAGVRVAFTLRGESHRAHRLRLAAGNAVAAGFPHDAALAAITRIPAEIFAMVDEGSLRPGALANLVVWNGDPLETMSWPTRVFIRGRPVELRSRQDLLTERYLAR